MPMMEKRGGAGRFQPMYAVPSTGGPNRQQTHMVQGDPELVADARDWAA